MSQNDADMAQGEGAPAPTTDSGSQKETRLSAKMHFHAVHHGGQQLRRGKHMVRQEHDRMVGR